MLNKKEVVAVFENVTLHKEVVYGLVRVMLFLKRASDEGLEKINPKNLIEFGCKGRPPVAAIYIEGFIKCRMISSWELEEVVSGNYSIVWQRVNSYLDIFGHEPIEPVDIELDI